MWDMLTAYARHDPRWFAPLDRYAPGPEFLTVHHRHVPAPWTLSRRGPWFLVEPPEADRVAQGWKLHLSSHLDSAAAMLDAVFPVLVEHRVRFKYLLDPTSLAMVNDKRWSRPSSGKFVTVYPPDADAFRLLAKELTDATDGLAGPHVLTDRPVPGSRCLSYRYGGFAAISTMQADGAPALMVHRPDGTPVPDDRRPYYEVPSWAQDPFGDPEPSAAVPTLADGRFEVTGALAFTNAGGVYLATDNTDGATVVLKEARPGVLVGRARAQAVDVLRREYRILRRLSDVPTVVGARALFTEGEHVFLAEDRVPGGQVSTRAIATHPVNTAEGTGPALRRYFVEQRRWWLEVLDTIEAAHARGVLLADLSFTNVLHAHEDPAVTGPGPSIRVIDLEAAIEAGVDESLGLSTPGVSAPRSRQHDEVDRAGDLHALGALMLGSLMLVNAAVGWHRPLLPGFLAALAHDLNTPVGLTELIAELMDPDADPAGVDPTAVRARILALDLDGHPGWAEGTVPPLWRAPAPATDDDRARVRASVDGVLDTIVATATPLRTDRLFPGHPYQYQTNAYSLAHGGAGVLHALRVAGADRDDVRRTLDQGAAWLLRSPITARTAPPGLYGGRAGVAWVLDDLGHRDAARSMLRDAAHDPLLAAEHGMAQGSAGVGTACLRAWHAHGDADALRWAIDRGRALRDAAVIDGDRAHWLPARGAVPVGYAHGASGIATFLLWLGLATGDDSWRELGRAGLEHDLAQCHRLDGGLVSVPPTVLEPGATPSVLRAYWEDGSAGVLTAVLRHHAAHPEDALRAAWRTLRADVSRSYAVMPQLFHGIAGFAMVLLDAAELLAGTGSPDDAALADEARAESWRTVRGVLRFARQRADGVSYPGEQCLRESVDLATGSGGVLLALDRLLRSGPATRTNTLFMLDDLLPRR